MAPKQKDQGKRTAAGGGRSIGEAGKFEGEFQIQQNAPFMKTRLDIWDRLYETQKDTLAKKERKPIKVELPDGKIIDGQSWETTPMKIAEGISKNLAKDIVIAKLIYKEPIASLKAVVAADAGMGSDDEGEGGKQTEQTVLWDLTRPLEGSCRMELLKFDNAQGQEVFWHSSAHILGEAMERQFGCLLTVGPPLESGFYYDGYFGQKKLGADDFVAIEKQAAIVSKEEQTFDRLVLTKTEALELFSENPFKVQLITNKVPDGAMTSAYRCGSLIDLCRGPHVPTTGRVKAFMITKNSAAYWLGDQKLDSLQRIYGIAFPTDKHLKEYKKFLEEAEKRDHRNLGKQQNLFMHHPTASPGCTFWFPYGARIYNKLIEFMRSEYRFRGFSEVITPNMYSSSLFIQSGHYQNYKDDMYSIDVENVEWMLKPMNCPGHFLMFDSTVRSYKELPLRYADFGVLHRNEASGALSGLTRVRRFQQDDAHMFVRPDQIKEEVIDALNFLTYAYKIFGFECFFALSTRPKKALGSKESWDNAEAQLKAALDEFGKEWTLNPGDGAFYGPKIDIRLMDTMKRKHQCGTIQLDFNNPIRFNLQYKKEGVEEGDASEGVFQGVPDEKNDKGEVIWKEGKLKAGFERPVVIHRAILGSVERMSAILMEHYAGKWPFWLSPRQVMVVPVNANAFAYAKWVERQLQIHGLYAECDQSGNTLPKKVRNAQLAQWNYVVVVGEQESQTLSANLRQRDVEKPLGLFTMLELVAKFSEEGMPVSQKMNEFEAFEGRMPAVAAAATPAAAAAPAAAGGARPALKKLGSSLSDRKGLSKSFAGLEVEDCVEEFLEDHPYVKGFQPMAADRDMYDQLSKDGCDFPQTPNLRRWFDHVGTFSALERSSW